MSDYPQYPSDQGGTPGANPYGESGAATSGKPSSVDLAVKILWGAIALFIVSSIINFTSGGVTFTGTGMTAEQEDAATGIVLGIGAVIIVLLVGLFVLLTVFISKGANWARITTTVLTAIGVALTVPSLFTIGASGQSALSIVVSLVQIALCVVAVVLCFRPDANAYFSAR